MAQLVVYHIVWIKYKSGTSQNLIDCAVAGSDLLRSIEGVLSVRMGVNITERSKGYQLGLVVVLNSSEALAHYGPHPVHVKFKSEFLAPIQEDVMAMDFEAPPFK